MENTIIRFIFHISTIINHVFSNLYVSSSLTHHNNRFFELSLKILCPHVIVIVISVIKLNRYNILKLFILEDYDLQFTWFTWFTWFIGAEHWTVVSRLCSRKKIVTTKWYSFNISVHQNTASFFYLCPQCLSANWFRKKWILNFG